MTTLQRHKTMFIAILLGMPAGSHAQPAGNTPATGQERPRLSQPSIANRKVGQRLQKRMETRVDGRLDVRIGKDAGTSRDPATALSDAPGRRQPLPGG